MRLTPTLIALAAVAAAPAAKAGETACWLDQGAVVVAAEVAGITADYILDTGAPQTLLADTQAQGAGYEATSLMGDIRLAGLTLKDRPLQVANIDVRTGLFPTPIAGVIGADVLKDYVLDLRLDPCRVSLWRPGRAPPFRATERLPLGWIGGEPAVSASVSDGVHAWTGVFAIATGADAPLRISDAFARAPGAEKPAELYPYGVLRPRLRALSFAGALFADVPGGLLKTSDPALAGQIGAPVLWPFRLRFDFPAGRLSLAPNEKGPGGKPRPSKARP